jgi:hypothetical protein
MGSQRLTGIILLVVGVVLLTLGLRATDSVSDRFSNFFTGHFTEATVWYILGGTLAGVAGLGMLVAGGRRSAI